MHCLDRLDKTVDIDMMILVEQQAVLHLQQVNLKFEKSRSIVNIMSDSD